jgi:hypothetical protein
MARAPEKGPEVRKEKKMSVLRPRNRLVNFRLSEDEFERLKASCALQGARSVSDFARSAVLERMEMGHAPAHSTARSYQVDNRLAELEAQMGQLLNLMHATGVSMPVEKATPALAEYRKG